MVKFNNTISSKEKITCGVPQGSVLGPLLFLIYMNDIHKCSNILSFILFADDTNAFYSDTNVKSLKQTLNNELIKVSKWLQVNTLTLNIKKTQVILFNAKNKKIKEPLKLQINGENIKQVNSTNFLGIIIDSKLTWKQHIVHIQHKISKTTGIICKTRHYVSLKVLRAAACKDREFAVNHRQPKLTIRDPLIHCHIYCKGLYGNAMDLSKMVEIKITLSIKTT